MLELLNGLLAHADGVSARQRSDRRLALVREKLETLAEEEGVDLARPERDLDAAVAEAVALGARDIFLNELLEIARADGDEPLLLQTAVSHLPVSRSGLQRMFADRGESPGELAESLCRLVGLSLLVEVGDGMLWVHRWTAEGLVDRVGAEVWRQRCSSAGRYRLWRLRDPRSAIYRRELGIALLQVARATESAEELREAAGILVDLRRRGALEDRFVPLADQLSHLVDD